MLSTSTIKKSKDQLATMRRAGRVVAEMHADVRAAIRPGVTTAELDQVARAVLERRGAQSNFLGYHGFPAVICTSPNDVIVHGIPGSYRLKDGDIISIDCGAIIDGWHGDAAFTTGVGTISAEAARLIEVTEASLAAGIAAMVDGNRISDIGHAVQTVAEAGRVLGGAGVRRPRHRHGDAREARGAELRRPRQGPKLKPGMVFAVEPMVNVGSPRTKLMDDGWTVKTADGALSAHTEHTIAITDNGPEILITPYPWSGPVDLFRCAGGGPRTRRAGSSLASSSQSGVELVATECARSEL